MRVSLVLLVLGFLWSQASALTIYRIGGQSLPPPELDAPYEFVSLAWADADEARDGQIKLVEAEADFIRPQRLDPTVNIAPQIYELDGGTVFVMHSHTGWTENLEGRRPLHLRWRSRNRLSGRRPLAVGLYLLWWTFPR